LAAGGGWRRAFVKREDLAYNNLTGGGSIVKLGGKGEKGLWILKESRVLLRKWAKLPGCRAFFFIKGRGGVNSPRGRGKERNLAWGKKKNSARRGGL